MKWGPPAGRGNGGEALSKRKEDSNRVYAREKAIEGGVVGGEDGANSSRGWSSEYTYDNVPVSQDTWGDKRMTVTLICVKGSSQASSRIR